LERESIPDLGGRFVAHSLCLLGKVEELISSFECLVQIECELTLKVRPSLPEDLDDVTPLISDQTAVRQRLTGASEQTARPHNFRQGEPLRQKPLDLAGRDEIPVPVMPTHNFDHVVKCENPQERRLKSRQAGQVAFVKGPGFWPSWGRQAKQPT
jgi:hypothetical protein